MRKFILLLAMLVSSLSLWADDVISHDVSGLPEIAQKVITDNFKAEISYIKIDKDFGRISDYKVVLSDGSEIKFERSGAWEEVEVNSPAVVPDYFIHRSIKQFVNKKHKGANIVKIEKERRGYEIELSNGIDIKFNPKGEFVRYDD